MPTAVFLPGILAPAVVRYAPLRAALGDGITTRVRELELYNFSPPPPGYGVDVEVEALRRCLDREGSAVHLYAHSGGGAVALAFVAAHPELAISLAVDEPAYDFTTGADEELEPYWPLMETLQSDPAGSMAKFLALELKPEVEFSPPAGAPPPLPNRPGGVATLLRAFRAATVILRITDASRVRCCSRAEPSAIRATRTRRNDSRDCSQDSAKRCSEDCTTSTLRIRRNRIGSRRSCASYGARQSNSA